jgi:uncharacterized repeat protein (TIGR01451 family)
MQFSMKATTKGVQMKLSRTQYLIASAIVWAALLMGAHQAYALGTPAGTDVSNSASVDFTVGTVNQPDVTSNTVTFEVDRRIMLTVAELAPAGPTNVVAGALDQAITFTVTNDTNDTVDFRLTYTQDGADNFDTTGVQFYEDDGDNVFDPGDTLITFLDNMIDGETRTVHVVSDIPSGEADGNTSSGTLTAIANSDGTGGGANDYVETNVASTDDPTFVDTVFGDAAGDTDAAEDGQHSDDDAYFVVTATITVTKTSTVISDPFNLLVNPKAIPGATIEYCIQVSNTGSAAASDVIVTDAIPANTTFVSGSIFADGTVTAGVCNADGSNEDDDNVGGDEAPIGGNFDGGTETVSTTVPAGVGVGATTTTRYRVTID